LPFSFSPVFEKFRRFFKLGGFSRTCSQAITFDVLNWLKKPLLDMSLFGKKLHHNLKKNKFFKILKIEKQKKKMP
jgi:hypothetical protein